MITAGLTPFAKSFTLSTTLLIEGAHHEGRDDKYNCFDNDLKKNSLIFLNRGKHYKQEENVQIHTSKGNFKNRVSMMPCKLTDQ